MTTVSRTSQVSHSSATGGGDWDHRLNRLLEDLQETVVPPDSRTGGTEYREYRMTSSTRTDDQPPISTEEKWIEYGTRGDLNGPYPVHSHSQLENQGFNYGPLSSTSTTTSSYGRTHKEKAIGYPGHNGSVEKTYNVDPGLKHDYSSGRTQSSQIEYLTPSNTTTVVKSSSTSPAPGTITLLPSSSPKVERKEFYAKASYTTLIKGGPDGTISLDTDDFQPIRETGFPQLAPNTRPALNSSTTSESRREYKSSTETRRSPGPGYRLAEPLDPPLYSSTPLQPSSYTNTRVNTDRSVTPPPRSTEGLKTPPLIRKIMQQTQTSSYSKEVTSTGPRPPVGGTPQSAPIIPYDHETPKSPTQHFKPYEHENPKSPTQHFKPYEHENPKSPTQYFKPYEHETPKSPTQYYTSTTTRTETRERDASPVRRFPSPQPQKLDGGPPKRLDELLATFDESYTETSRISGDGGGPWKSHPYGPGTQPIRAVRIDDNVQSRNISTVETDGLHQRPSKPTTAVVETKNVSGPPVFYPPGQIFSKTEQEALLAAEGSGKGKGKMKMEREYKAKEKSKQSHSERGGQGAVPVPVCLPICCAAPCTII